MRTLSPALQASLAEGATTLARCWTLMRRDGVTLGFTDHDRDITLEGVAHRAGTGLDAAQARQELGFAVASVDAAGALSEAGLTEADIMRGLYDGASVTVTLVDWANPAARAVLDRFEIGEIRRGDGAFVAELRGQAHRFDEERGRLYAATCDADLGDARCRVAIAPITTPVVATDGRRVVTLALPGTVQAGHLSGGRLTFATGANAGLVVEIQHHAEGGRLTLWLDAAQLIAVGDQATVTPGCDKSFATCRDRFANTLNFQGFPHIPGTAFLLRAGGEAGHVFDGGSLFR
jgi:uncharacterized phage protein (TIGR02218 family)